MFWWRYKQQVKQDINSRAIPEAAEKGKLQRERQLGAQFLRVERGVGCIFQEVANLAGLLGGAW